MLSDREKIDLLISWIGLSFAFAWMSNIANTISALPTYLIIVGTAFVLHELSHKYTALKLGYPAEYRMWDFGVLLAISVAVLSGGRFVFAAPGAVYILGHPNTKDNGKIALAGPLANLIVAYILLLTAIYSQAVMPIRELFLKIAWVNCLIGLFNMLPIYPLDGSKVIQWSPAIYAATVGLFLLFLIL